MMLRLHTYGLRLAAAFLLWSVAYAGIAQAPASTQSETWKLYVGEMIEVLPVHEVRDPKYGWVLIKDATQTTPEQFIEGGTASFYRYRPTQPGKYTLFGDIASSDGALHIQRTFRFDVLPRETVAPSSAPSENSGSGTQLVRMDPPLQADGSVVLRQNQQMVRIIPADPELKNIALDADTQTDADGDGNPSNDVQNQETFFQKNSTPLFLWIALSDFSTQEISLTAVDSPNGQGAEVQNVKLYSFDFAKNNNLLTSAVKIQTKTASGGIVSFQPVLDGNFPPEVPLIYRWTFGDGEESLETQPSHSYAAPGTYAVSLQVRNLTNGREVAATTAEVTIAPSAAPSSAPSSAAASSAASEPSNEVSGPGFFETYRTVIIALAVLFGSVLLGAGLIFLLSRFKKGNSLDEHLARMEQNILSKEKSKILDSAAPMAIPASVIATPVTSEAQPANSDNDAGEAQRKRAEEEIAAAAPSPDALTINEEKAPAWLKKGLVPDAVKTPEPAAPVAAPAPAPEPAVPAAQPQSAPAEDSVPDWLKTAPAPVTPAPEAAPLTPAPAPQAPVTPETATTPEAELPDWLKPTATLEPTPAPVAEATAPVIEPKPEEPKAEPAAPVVPVEAPKAEVPAVPATQPVTETPVAAVTEPIAEVPKIETPSQTPAPVETPAAPVIPPVPAEAPAAPVVEVAPATPAETPKVPETIETPVSAAQQPAVETPAPVVAKAPETTAQPTPAVPAPQGQNTAQPRPPRPQQNQPRRQDNRPPRQPNQPRNPRPQNSQNQPRNPQNQPRKDQPRQNTSPSEQKPSSPSPAPEQPKAPESKPQEPGKTEVPSFAQAPVVEIPKPIEPSVPASTPEAAPAPAVAQETPPAPVAPVTPATPVEAPKPVSEPQDILPAEEPIAFIRAESLNPTQPPNPQA